MPRPVVEAVKAYFDLEAAWSGHGAAEREAERLGGVYGSVARLIGAAPDEIALTESATRAWQMAFYALARSLRPGDRILIGRQEYGASLVALRQVAAATGAVCEVLPATPDGPIDVAALGGMLDGRVRLIAATAIPSNGGLVNPVAEIGALARAHAIPFLLDACQMVGQRPVDVAALGCDLLAATGRKFLRGPRGTGFLYVRRAWIDQLQPAMLDHFGAPLDGHGYRLRDDARRFETYEHDHAARLGLGVAAEYALGLGLDQIAARIGVLADSLRQGIGALPGARVHDLGPDPAGLVTFTLAGQDSAAVRAALGRAGIAAGLSLHAAAPLDAEARALPPLVRLSPHVYNSEDEIGRALDVLARINRGELRP
ncbi:aminotransferase [Methylobacterium radiodurans]|uniref:Aminotransferase n=2 Tax=Methylobacterium radiodurans TaxID=2202828 RepID=A0A2U8W0C4_9HYPH|nr:aminotransferase [Methylobacterium radiodurans]